MWIYKGEIFRWQKLGRLPSSLGVKHVVNPIMTPKFFSLSKTHTIILILDIFLLRIIINYSTVVKRAIISIIFA